MITVIILASGPVLQRGLSSLCVEMGLRPKACISSEDSLNHFLMTENDQNLTIWLIENYFHYLAPTIKPYHPNSILILYKRTPVSLSSPSLFCGAIEEGKNEKIQLEAILQRYISISCNNIELYENLTKTLHQRHRNILYLMGRGVTKERISEICDISQGTLRNYLSELRKSLGMEPHEIMVALFQSGLYYEWSLDPQYSSMLPRDNAEVLLVS
jgi:DNA-binding CsgD family transcriptional regulator